MQRQKLRVFLTDFDECLTHLATDKNPKRIGRSVYEAGLSRCKTPAQRKAYLAQNMKPRVAELFRKIIQTDSCVAGILTFSNDPETVKEHLLAAGLSIEEIKQIKFRFRPVNFDPNTSKKDEMALEIINEIGRENIECVYFADDTERHVQDVQLCCANLHIPCQAMVVPRGMATQKMNIREFSFIDRLIESISTHITQIPKDVINHLSRFADPETVLALNATCHFFRAAIRPEIKEGAKHTLRNDVLAVMRHLKSKSPKLGFTPLNCSFFGNINTGKDEIINTYAKPYPILAANNDFSTIIVSTDNIDLAVSLWSAANQLMATQSKILVACATINFEDYIPGKEQTLIPLLLRIQLKKLNEFNPDAVKVALINTEMKAEISSDHFSAITTALRNEFGTNLICHQVDTRTGKGIKNALDSAIASALLKAHGIQRAPESSAKCTLM